MHVVIAGAGPAGLGTALLLARDGHEVTVLDRDPLIPAPDVETAAASAVRAAAPQIVQPHALLARARNMLRERFPDVLDRLLDAGALEGTIDDQLPPWISDRSPRPGDEQLTTIYTRRSTFDWVLLQVAAEQPGICLRGGARVTGLLTKPSSPPDVYGVCTTAGDVVADVVIDATGRRSPIDRWLGEAGATAPPQLAAECGLAYFSRHFRRRPGASLPGREATRVLAALDEFTVGMWSADNGAMQFVVAPLTGDRRFRPVTDPEVFTAVLRTVPVLAAWLGVLEPEGPVYAMAGLHNTMRRLVVDGDPVVTGLHIVGDSVCTTNPTFGRGIALALQGAADLSETLQDHTDPAEAALQLDRLIDEHVQPFYDDQATNDSRRLAALRHAVFGEPRPNLAPSEPDRVDFEQLRSAAVLDPDVFRAFMRMFGMLELPEAVYRDPAVVASVKRILAEHDGSPPMPQVRRHDLLDALC